ncbi:MAG: DEAD/DEAH box helicase family protein [Microbacteriaceae bacterium]|nr:DEAD/DEAH box helicase family protein [Microbacteriaceae bacterium]
MVAESSDALLPEQRARARIDDQLERAGWVVVRRKQDLNLFAGQGVALYEKVMAPGHGEADYILYVDRRVVGVIEAKKEGTPLAGVEWQSAMYATGLPEADQTRAELIKDRLPFVFEANGAETYFTNGYDPDPRSRKLFHFPRPESLARIVADFHRTPPWPTWRAAIQLMPPLITEGLRPAQIEAVTGLEQSLSAQHYDRSLIQMATGAGKTYTAITSAYRLLKYGGFKRVLFLVDRNNLGDQTLGEFSNYQLPDDGRRFTEVYGVDKLTRAGLSNSTSVLISTIQRVYSVLRGQEVSTEDDPGVDDFTPDQPVTVEYNPDLPPEAFDLVIVDEAHRSIYGVWRGVLDYFDAHVVGLTATPGKQTFAYFQQNLVSEYTYPQSVADGVNVDFDIYRIATEITAQGSRIEAGTIVPVVDRRTRAQRLMALADDVDYAPGQLDRAVTSTSQIRLVLETFRDRLFTEIFPGRSVVPKTLIFAKDDAHAEEIVRQVRQVFGKGNDFAAKITYTAKDAKTQLQVFRQSPTLRVAVTVDMIATGTDVKPLECVFFMRDVRSAQYFEQMKGRGARTIADADFQAVTPDSSTKTRFVIVDAVGVTEHAFVEPPLNRAAERGISLERLLEKVANLTIAEDEVATLASRLAALGRQITADERRELDDIPSPPEAGGVAIPLRRIIRGLVDAVDPDEQARAIDAAPGSDAAEVVRTLLEDAVKPLAANPVLRDRILELRRARDQIVDEVSVDVLLDAHGVVDPGRARSIVESWAQYLADHRDEITAIQVIQQAHGHVTFVDIKELADRVARPPHNWTPELLWAAYEAVEASKVKGPATKTLTNLVSLLRFTLGVDAELVPYADQVHTRYAEWLHQQEAAGANFTPEQRWWLDTIVEVITKSAGITDADLDNSPFAERGGVDGIVGAFGDRAGQVLAELNERLTA